MSQFIKVDCANFIKDSFELFYNFFNNNILMQKKSFQVLNQKVRNDDC